MKEDSDIASGILEALSIACNQGDRGAVSQCLTSCSEGNKLNQNYNDGSTRRNPLHRAAAYGHTAVFDALIQAGANINVANSDGRTALHEACIGGHQQIVNRLLNLNADVMQLDRHGQTALHAAAYNGETECLQCFLKQDKGLLALDHRDNYGRLPHHLAVMNDHANALRLLLSKTTTATDDITIGDGRLLLHYAALQGARQCIDCLVGLSSNLRALLNKTDHKGLLASHCAVLSDHVMCMHDILVIMSELEIDTSHIPLAHTGAMNGSLKCLHWLLGNDDTDNNMRREHGNTLLHLAAAQGDPKCINCIVTHGVTNNQVNDKGMTATTVAREHGHPLAYSKAVSGEVRCPHCLKDEKDLAYERANEPSNIEMQISNQSRVIFESSDLRNLQYWRRNDKKRISQQQQVRVTRQRQPSSLAAKYYGDQLLRFSDVIDQSNEIQTRKDKRM